ncbi:COX15/CtaA family protein [Nocardia sp. NPDC003482]
MLTRAFLRLVDLLPLPSVRAQRIIAFLVIASQAGISVTGAVVRVTSSGLGCPTWPRCFPGSFTPVAHAEVPVLHQAIEFSNRMLTFAVTLCAALVVLAVLRARRRREVLVYAWLMPGGTVLQAVIGGFTVLTGLLWWTVAVHLLASMLMVWLAVLLFAKIGEPDDGVPVAQVPAPLRWLTVLSALALCATLIAGTLVTGAGPHAGDKSVDKPVARLEVEIVTLVHAHAQFLVAYLALLVGLGFGLAAVGMTRAIRVRLFVLIALVCAQGLVGVVQYFTHVPAALVAVHVGGAAACTAATAALWAALRTRETVSAAPASAIAETTGEAMTVPDAARNAGAGR